MKLVSFMQIMFLFLLVVSCNKQESFNNEIVDDNGVYISLNYLWKTSLHEDNIPITNSCFREPIIYQNNIAIPTTKKDSTRYMTLIDSNNGGRIWSWSDLFQNPSPYIDISHAFIYNDLLTWQRGYNSYCIDLSDGTTKWKFVRDTYYEIRINQYYDEYFLTAGYIRNQDGYDERAAFVGDIETGELNEFLRVNLTGEYIAPTTTNGGIGGVNYINKIPDSDFLLITYSEPLPEWQVRSMFGLYNTETETWIYERVELAEPHWNNSVFHIPIIHNDKIYANVGYSIVCHDLMTGEQLWRRNFNNDFLFSGFIIEEGKIIAMCENTTLYCLDPETGSTMWEGEGAGTSNKMSYLNGIVYFIGGSTQKLHAIDVSTGTTVWRINTRNLGEEYSKFGPSSVCVIEGKNGEKGKIVAFTAKYAICYEAYK